MSTPIIQNLIPSLRETVFKHLQSYLGGEGELSSIMESLEFWYDRLRDKEHPDLPMWQDLPSVDADQLFDAWHAALEDFFRQRLTQSDPPTSSRLFKPVADQCPDCGLVGAHFCTRGMPLIDCPECGAHGPHVCITGGFVPGVSSPSPASSVVPAPLVPEVVKRAQEGSVCKVDPLGEIDSMGSVHFKDEDGDRVEFWISGADDGFGLTCSEIQVFFPKDKVPSLIAHLTAWLDTGSFDLKGLPSSPPSSEDTQEFTDSERLEHLMRFTSPPVDRAKLDRCIRSEREASTTTQKGGQGA